MYLLNILLFFAYNIFSSDLSMDDLPPYAQDYFLTIEVINKQLEQGKTSEHIWEIIYDYIMRTAVNGDVPNEHLKYLNHFKIYLPREKLKLFEKIIREKEMY